LQRHGVVANSEIKLEPRIDSVLISLNLCQRPLCFHFFSILLNAASKSVHAVFEPFFSIYQNAEARRCPPKLRAATNVPTHQGRRSLTAADVISRGREEGVGGGVGHERSSCDRVALEMETYSSHIRGQKS
jgi:hypothetical protein